MRLVRAFLCGRSSTRVHVSIFIAACGADAVDRSLDPIISRADDRPLCTSLSIVNPWLVAPDARQDAEGRNDTHLKWVCRRGVTGPGGLDPASRAASRLRVRTPRARRMAELATHRGRKFFCGSTGARGSVYASAHDDSSAVCCCGDVYRFASGAGQRPRPPPRPHVVHGSQPARVSASTFGAAGGTWVDPITRGRG